MTDEPGEAVHGEALPHFSGDSVAVIESQVGRLHATTASADRSQMGYVTASTAKVTESRVGFVLGRDVHIADTEAGIVVAFNTSGTITTQIDARALVGAAAAFAAVLFVLGRLFRRG